MSETSTPTSNAGNNNSTTNDVTETKDWKGRDG